MCYNQQDHSNKSRLLETTNRLQSKYETSLQYYDTVFKSTKMTNLRLSVVYSLYYYPSGAMSSYLASQSLLIEVIIVKNTGSKRLLLKSMRYV